MKGVTIYNKALGPLSLQQAERAIWKTFGLLQKEFRLQAGHQIHCFARKGILGSNRMQRSFGSMEKFINITQSKRSQKLFICFVFVA